MPRIVVFSIFILSIFVAEKCLGSTFPNLKFRHVSISEGISNRIVNLVTQDQNGSILFGTSDGLNRLDGYRVKSYFYEPKQFNSIPDNAINACYRSKNNTSWFSTETGVFIYNSKTKKIEIPPFIRHSNLMNEFKVFFFENKHVFYFFGQKNYYTKAPNSKLVKHQFKGNSKLKIKPNKPYAKVFRTKKNTIFGFEGRHLIRLNSNNLAPEKVITIGDSLNLGITDVIEFGGSLWLTTWGNGVFSYDSKTKKIVKLNLKDQVCHCIKAVNVENKTYLLVGSFLGYTLIDPKTNSFKEINLGTEVWSIFLDSNSNLWLATNNGAFVYKHTSSSLKKHIISDEAEQINVPLINKLTGNFFSTKNYYFATLIYGNGVLVYSKKWKLLNYIPSLSPDPSLPLFKDIRYIYEHKNHLWITSDAGLSKCDTSFHILKHFTADTPENPNRNLNKMRRIIPYKSDKLIIQNVNSIGVFDLKTERFIKIFDSHKNKINQLPNQWIVGISLMNDQLYLAFENDLRSLNLVSGKISKVPFSLYKKRLRNLLRINSTLWIGTQTGLYSFDLKTHTTKGFFRKDGFKSDHILRSNVDKKGNIWMLTNDGIAVLNTKNLQIKTITTEDGLSEKIMEGGLFIDDNQTIIAGSINEFTEIKPAFWKEQKKTRKSTINELVQGTKDLPWKEENTKKTIVLDYDKNSLGIHFSIPDYSVNEQQDYFYCVNGKWSSQKSGFITLNNLPEGNYEIIVGNSAFNSPLFDRIHIKVLPPYYRTWWFRGVILLLFAMLIWFFWKIRIQHLRKQLELKDQFNSKLKESEMTILRSQMNPHFIFNSLNSINHYIITNEKKLASDYLTMFAKLIRNILENSKNTSISLKSELETLKLYLKLESVRLENKFDFIIQHPEIVDLDFISIPPLIIQPFVENAIWHGIQEKDGQGMIEISVHQLSESEICITITDNGIGRKAAALKKTSEKDHKSYGIDITIERVQFLNPLNKIVITDLYDQASSSTGTKVELFIHC